MPRDTVDELLDELSAARQGPADAYVAVLERALDLCATHPATAEELDELGLHDDLAEAYDGLGRVEEALAHADVLVERGYRCAPDPRCRRAEILMRHGRVDEAAGIWAEVARDTPDDVWVFNIAGLEYAAVGDHATALTWLTRALELAVRTGDPERLLAQLRGLRGESLAALGAAGRRAAERRAGRPAVRGTPAAGAPVRTGSPGRATSRLASRGDDRAARLRLVACRRVRPDRATLARHRPGEVGPRRRRRAGRAHRLLPQARSHPSRGHRGRAAAPGRAPNATAVLDVPSRCAPRHRAGRCSRPVLAARCDRVDDKIGELFPVLVERHVSVSNPAG